MTYLQRLATQSGLLPSPRFVLDDLPTGQGHLVTVYDTWNLDPRGNRYVVQATIRGQEDPIHVLRAIRRSMDAGAARHGKAELLPFGCGLSLS